MDIQDGLLVLSFVIWLFCARTLCDQHEHAAWLDRVRSRFVIVSVLTVFHLYPYYELLLLLLFYLI